MSTYIKVFIEHDKNVHKRVQHKNLFFPNAQAFVNAMKLWHSKHAPDKPLRVTSENGHREIDGKWIMWNDDRYEDAKGESEVQDITVDLVNQLKKFQIRVAEIYFVITIYSFHKEIPDIDLDPQPDESIYDFIMS